jgi:hypothetical protein
VALKIKLTTVPERYQRKLTEHILHSPESTLSERGALMKRGPDGRFRNPLVSEATASGNGRDSESETVA